MTAQPPAPPMDAETQDTIAALKMVQLPIAPQAVALIERLSARNAHHMMAYDEQAREVERQAGEIERMIGIYESAVEGRKNMRDALREQRDKTEAAESSFAAMRAALEQWSRPDHIRLHAGEMTAQEMRSVLAVVNAIKTRTFSTTPTTFDWQALAEELARVCFKHTDPMNMPDSDAAVIDKARAAGLLSKKEMRDAGQP